MDFITIFGYAGSVLVAVSLTMSSIVKLRIINFFGASCFATYGLIIGAYPVFFLNGFITLIDIYYLIQIFSAKEYFRILEVSPNSEYLSYFLKFHEKEIKNFIPSFEFVPNENYHVMFVLRDTVSAGLVISEYLENDVVYMKLDYAVPGYRDFKMGKYVFAKIFKNTNVSKIYSEAGNPKHEKYLQKMGFVKSNWNNNEVYLLSIKPTTSVVGQRQ